MMARPVGDILKSVAALRKFCLTLPHAPTPYEVQQLQRFEGLRRGVAPLTHEDIDALRSGLRDCWCRRDAETLREMAARVPPELLERDRWLQSFVVAARERSKSTARG